MTRIFQTVLLMLALAIPVMGCTSAPVQVATRVQFQDNTASVTVDNKHWAYMRVYVSENDNTPFRLGQVESHTTAKFRMPARYGSSYRFVLIPLGAYDSTVLEPLSISPGDSVVVVVHSHLPMSFSWSAE